MLHLEHIATLGEREVEKTWGMTAVGVRDARERAGWVWLRAGLCFERIACHGRRSDSGSSAGIFLTTSACTCSHILSAVSDELSKRDWYLRRVSTRTTMPCSLHARSSCALSSAAAVFASEAACLARASSVASSSSFCSCASAAFSSAILPWHASPRGLRTRS